MSRIGLALSLALFGAVTAGAADPLRCVPRQAVFTLAVENPRKLAETTLGFDAFKGLADFPAVREVLDGTAVRRGQQLVAYLERETGSRWPELLDKVAGNGMVIAGMGNGDTTLIVLEGADEAATKAVFELVVKVAGDEQARQGNAEPVRRERRGGVDLVTLNTDAFLARHGATVLVSNKSKGIAAALDLLASGKSADGVLGKPGLAAANRQLLAEPLAWFWIDFATLKAAKETKDFFENTRKDVFQTLLFGGTADCLRRSDYVEGGLYEERDGFRFAVRLPAGRDGFPPEFALHVPPAGTPGSLPLLEPAGVLYSQSFYLDLGTLWTERDKLINAQVRGQLEKAEKDLSKFVPGVKFGELLSLWGGHHRFVAVNVDKAPYKTEPGQKLPAFGYVTSMRDPQFGKSVEGLIRGAGFLFSLSQGLKLVEETADGVKVFAYRFPEDRPYPGDDANVRFNFEPAFAIVGDQFVAASTLELARKLVAEVKRTATRPGSPEVWRAKAYAAGVADILTAVPDAAVSDAILRQAISLADARRQVDQFAAYLRTLGTVALELDEAAKEYRFDVVWRVGK